MHRTDLMKKGEFKIPEYLVSRYTSKSRCLNSELPYLEYPNRITNGHRAAHCSYKRFAEARSNERHSSGNLQQYNGVNREPNSLSLKYRKLKYEYYLS